MGELKILVILGSTREGRAGEKVAKWVMEELARRTDAAFELADLKIWKLPYFEESESPQDLKGNYKTPGAAEWAKKVDESDGFLIITPEYNHGYPAVLKNALDFAYLEWNRKPVAFVSYGGGAGGARSAEQLKQVAVELEMAPVKTQLVIPRVWEAFDEAGQPKNPNIQGILNHTVNDLLWWTRALKDAKKSQ